MARPPPSTGGPPISFKTVPGRHRTQKWNVARQYDYSGDDWGGYDPYDDYGEQQPATGMQQGGPYSAGPAPQAGYGGLPSQQPAPAQRARQQSFDEGDERRAFSGPTAPGWDINRGGSPARSAVSSGSGSRPSGDYHPGTGPGSRMRDFTNPEQVPPPLNTRGSPAPMPGMPMTAPAGGPFAPRKQSLSRGSPAPDAVPVPANTAPSTAVEKELPTPPFIRPSDIYKRMAEEKEKERKNSLDSTSRPSLDTRDSSAQRPLSSVDEGAAGSEDEGALSANVSGPMDVPHDFGEPSQPVSSSEKSLPPIQAVSGFGSSMFGSSAATDLEQTPTSPPQQSTSSSLQATPTATRAPPGSDPAADILAERTHETPVSAIGRRPDELSHQASQASSQGFTSAVNRAFDQSDLSRDSSQSTKQSGDVSRSNTTSTSGISPIMSRAPWSEQMAPAVPTIAEEYQGRASSDSSRNVIPRKPSPQQSANASPRPSLDANRDLPGGPVERGYRRSLDPPSSDNSPARTPGLESVEGPGRRFSAGMSAQTISAAEAEAETSQQDQLEERMTRPRAGTDYSTRESDLAREINSSPDKGSFDATTAQAAQEEQDLFVRTHSQPSAPGMGFDPPASGRSSPAKGRVREIADQYQDLHDQSRRGSTASSKSSWSNFRGSEENLPGKLAKRQGTKDSSTSDYAGVEDGGIRDSPVDASAAAPIAEPPPIDGRPGLPSQQSFRPQLPGGWISYSNTSRSGTPGGGSLAPTSASPVQDDRTSWFPGDDGPVDLTPTTRKVPLEGSHHSPSNSMMGQAKDAGTALGAALMSSVGLGHQTRDFGSAQPAQEVEVPNEDRKLAGETRGLNVPERPQYNRGDTEASAITTVSNPSVVSANSSRPPTPPAKDTPQPPTTTGGYDRENNYFSAAIAPLRTGRSREASPELQPKQAFGNYGGSGSNYSTSLHRDDTIRREIVRDLDQQEDKELTQDALDAPSNAARVSAGGNALPATEISDDSPNKPHPLRMLDQRFSWEQTPEDRGLLDTPRKEQDAPMVVQAEGGREIGAIGGVPRVREPDPESSPEIRPEMPYERPRSRGLHIMNASGSEDSDDDTARRPTSSGVGMTAALGAGAVGAAGLAGAGLAAGTLGAGGPVSPLTKSQENLHLGVQQQVDAAGEDERRSSLRDLAPSPISQGSGSVRLPSYYIQDSSTLGLGVGMDSALSPPLPQEENRDLEADTDAAAPEVVSPTKSGPQVLDASVPKPPEKEKETSSTATSPTSPTSKQKIPPFREILAIKNTDARIKGYDDTRRTFADMNTGLSDWLSGMLAQNPEYASLSTATPQTRPALQTSTSGFKGHKASPSISKFTKFGGAGSGDPQRTQSVNAGASGSGATGAGSVDMDKLQQRGKDLMKGAGVLGGKGVSGAKGLLAKGKSRFGTQRESRGKAVSPTTTFHMVPPATPALSSATKSQPEPVSPPPVSSPVRSSEPFGTIRDGNLAVPLAPADDASPVSPPAPTVDAGPASPPADSTSRALSPASTTTPPPDSALTVPISNTVASSVYSASPPTIQPLNAPDRSQTQTPASTSTTSGGGVVSRTLSRLRERSRSLSSSRRSRSRPQSLVLLSSNHGSELKTVQDASPQAAQGEFAAAPAVGGAGRGSEFGMQAISPWDEPDEVSAMGGMVGGVPLPERLGVLPSPAADGFSILQESPIKRRESREVDGMPPESPTKDRGFDDELMPETPTRGRGMREQETRSSIDEHSRGLQATTGLAIVADVLRDKLTPAEDVSQEDRQDDVNDASRVQSSVYEDDELYDVTPKKLSPTSPGHVEAMEDGEETTPTSAQFRDSRFIVDDSQLASEGVEQVATGAKSNLPAPESRDLGADAAISSPEPESTDTTAPVSRQSTDLLTVPTIAEPSSIQEWDNRSGVSSNNDFHDAIQENGEEDKQSSRRSSVSSLGQDEGMAAEQPVMSSQAVPAGPSPEQSTLKPDDKFMNRPYQFGDAQDGRSKSYLSLGHDSTGAPLQETIDVAEKPKHDSVDLTTFGGPPAGTTPFQRHPAVRDISGESKPKRFSGVVKGRRPTLPSDSTPDTTPTKAPPASAISDHYGLEGLQADDEDVVVGEMPPYRLPNRAEDKRAKRKSGLFDAFKRSPSVSKTEASRESSSQRLDSHQSSAANLPLQESSRSRAIETPRGAAQTPHRATQAPQRASTTAKEPEQKKKRFSGLGSIFGRSSTTGHKSEKPRKLMKQIPDQASQRQSTAPLPNQEANEAMRQQWMRDQQERQPRTYPPPIMGPRSHQYPLTDGNLFKSPEDTVAPPGGWYGPQSQEANERSVPTDDPPAYRPLHSDMRRSQQPRHVSAPLRTVDPAYNERATPFRAPSETGVYSPPSSPVSTGVQGRYPTYGGFDSRPNYGPRHGSNGSEISGESEWRRSEWRRENSSPSISPIQTRRESDAFPPGRGMRVGSISEEMARSPAREYNDQQTPWSISLPRPGEHGPRRAPRMPSYGMQPAQGPPLPPTVDYAPGGIGYAEEYPPPNRWQHQRGLPMSPESPGSSMPTQQFDPVMAHAPMFDERPPRGIAVPQRNAYPSPPMSPESQWFYNRAGLNPPSQMQYDARSEEPELPRAPRKTSYARQRMYSYKEDAPTVQPRTMSGYTGRRDNPTLGEESVEMRGVSYPGQEWMPERFD